MKPRSERDLELDFAAATKAERGEHLTADEASRVRALEVRKAIFRENFLASLNGYVDAGIAERTERGYRVSADVARAEIAESRRRRRRRSRISFQAAVVRRVRAGRWQSAVAVAPGVRDASVRPRPRSTGRPRSKRKPARRPGGSDQHAEADPPPPAQPLTAESRQLLKEQVSHAARARAKREEKLKLPDGVDRATYCTKGHLRSIHQRTVIDRSRPSGLKTECGACKSERDARRSATASWWMPRIESRVVGGAGTLSESDAFDSREIENEVEST